jgi:hypothetical protein
LMDSLCLLSIINQIKSQRYSYITEKMNFGSYKSIFRIPLLPNIVVLRYQD